MARTTKNEHRTDGLHTGWATERPRRRAAERTMCRALTRCPELADDGADTLDGELAR